MSGLSLFLIFLVGGFLSCCIANIIVLPLKFSKKKAIIFIFDFINIVLICAIFQLMVTVTNFGIFRAYFTLSYIIGVLVCKKTLIFPIDKMIIKVYTSFKLRRASQCKEKNQP